MFWGVFLVLIGGLLLLDRWDYYHGGFVSKVLISALIAWGASMLFDRTCWHIGVRTDRTDDSRLSATGAATTSTENMAE